MTEKELRHLSRAQLLEMLLQQTERNEALQRELAEARAQLASRKIAIDNAGSIAQAALQLNGVFEACQRAADQYLENVRRQAGQGEQTEPKFVEREIWLDVPVRAESEAGTR